jgi:hypothetical protein
VPDNRSSPSFSQAFEAITASSNGKSTHPKVSTTAV